MDDAAFDTLVDLLRISRHSKSKRKDRERRRRNKNEHRERMSRNRIDNLPDRVFTRMFRLNRIAFNDLLQKITEVMPEKDAVEATRSSGSVIDNFVRLCMTLRWLAGGSYLDICLLYGADFSTFYAEDGILWPTI